MHYNIYISYNLLSKIGH